MFERTAHHTERTAAVVAGASGAVAEELRDQARPLDEVTRARMERSLVQAWRTRAALGVPLPESKPDRAHAWFGASLVVSAVAGGLIAFLVFGPPAASVEPASNARFELRIGAAGVQSGPVAEGQVLESGEHGYIDVDLGSARLHMTRGTRLRVDRLAPAELALSVSRGRVDFDFHPARKGEQRLVVGAPSARIVVVGTRFTVEVDRLGNTAVRVTEGVVEVMPRSGAAARRLAAGEQVEVRMDDGDATERAVRAELEAQLAAQEMAGASAGAGTREARAPHEGGHDAVDGAAQAAARKLAMARRLLRQGRHVAARLRLKRVAESGSLPVRLRAEALTLIAESYTAQGNVPRASHAYHRADQIAPTQAAGHNARFARARLLERYAHDTDAAARAYEHYLERAPGGALASQARQALCRLGRSAHCQ